MPTETFSDSAVLGKPGVAVPVESRYFKRQFLARAVVAQGRAGRLSATPG